MKKTVKTLIVLLAVLTLALCCFASCNKKAPDVTPSETEGEGNTDVPAAPDVIVDLSTLSGHTIIKRDEASAGESTAATLLSARIQELTGVKLSVKSDFLYPGEAPKETEILFGETNRAESAEAYEGLKYNDFIITQVGQKLIVAGGSVDALNMAVEYIVAATVDGKLTIKQGKYVYNAEYRFSDMTLGGVSLNEYSIVYGADKSTVAADVIKDAIGKASGIRLNIKKHNQESGEYEIVVGETNRGNNSVKCNYYSYKLTPQEKSLWINGYDVYALNAAAHYFEGIVEASNGQIDLAGLTYEYVTPTNKELTENIDLLYMRWEDEWQPPEGMLDYEGKKAALVNGTDRLLSCAHRADSYYYPENSLESIISFYKMGGDVVELDVMGTKDNVLILMHDTTLGRMTNASEFVGKTIDGITFPESYDVRAWTYEQIQYLNLKEGWGSSNKTMWGTEAKLTPFKVPTLAEALKVCKGRMFILTDKAQESNGGQWRYADISGVQESNRRIFLYDAMVEADNYESIILSYGYLTAKEAVSVQKYIKSKSGVTPLIIVRTGSASTAISYYEYLSEAAPGTFAIHIGGAYDDSFGKNYKTACQALKGKILILGWTILYAEKGGIDKTKDCEETWGTMYDLGYRMIMGNNYLKLVKYAAEIYKGLGE